MTDDKQAIREVIATWMDASKKGDTATVLGLMTDDVIFMVPGREPFGKTEFAASSRDMKDMQVDGTSDVKEIEMAGDWAWCRTHLKVAVTMPDGKQLRRSGYTLSVMRKTGGKWQLARDANMLTMDD